MKPVLNYGSPTTHNPTAKRRPVCCLLSIAALGLTAFLFVYSLKANGSQTELFYVAMSSVGTAMLGWGIGIYGLKRRERMKKVTIAVMVLNGIWTVLGLAFLGLTYALLGGPIDGGNMH